MDHDRGRVRHRAWRFDQFRVPVRAVRGAAGQGRGGQLLHPGGILADGPHARRPRQGRRRQFGDDRPDFRLVHRQCRHDRHLYHSADEEGGLFIRKGRRGRGRLVGERSDHAACDGCRRLPDGRICRNSLFRCGQERLHPGHDQLYRIGLYRPSRGDEGGHEGSAARLYAGAADASPDRFPVRHRRGRHPRVPAEGDDGLDPPHLRFRCDLGGLRAAGRGLSGPALHRLAREAVADG